VALASTDGDWPIRRVVEAGAFCILGLPHASRSVVSSPLLGLFLWPKNQASPGSNSTNLGPGLHSMMLILKALALTLLAYLLPLAVLILGSAGLLTP